MIKKTLNRELFSKRLTEILDNTNETTYTIGEALGMSAATISRYANGLMSPKIPTIEAMASYLKVNPLWLMGCDVDKKLNSTLDIFSIPNIIPIPKTKKVPLIGEIACGTPILAEQNISDYLSVSADIKCDFALKCKGDSMINARIFDGDIVLIKQQPDVENGEIAAVMIDGEATLKRVYKYPERIELRPENPTHKVINYEGEKLKEVKIIGKAVYFISKVI